MRIAATIVSLTAPQHRLPATPQHRHSRASGNLLAFDRRKMDPRLRGDDAGLV
jgi:hypothetical protein